MEDPRLVPVAGPEGQDALSALGPLGAYHPLQLSAGAGVLPGADTLGIHLAGEVDLHGVVDGDHMVVPGDVPGIVHPVDLLLAEGGILMGEGPQLRPAHHVGVYAPPRAGLFAAVVHHAPAHQLHDAGAQDLCVDAQIPLSRMGQTLAHSIGQPSQPQLDAGAVWH